MKKPEFRRKSKAKAKISSPQERITNDTLANYREEVLSEGRKFKYPFQYTKNRLVVIASSLVVVMVVLAGLIGWWQLYKVQNTSNFMLKVTKIMPLPVASVDGEPVRYRDYLIQYKLSEYYLGKYDEIHDDTEDGRLQLNHVKRESIDRAEKMAYARYLARGLNVAITDSELDDFIEKERNTSSGKVSQESYDASIRMIYGIEPDDYRYLTSESMLVRKVAFAIDDKAKAIADDIAAMIEKDPKLSLKDVQGRLEGSKQSRTSLESTAAPLGINDRLSGLRVSELIELKKGETAGPFKSITVGGYYFVTVTSKSNSKIGFEYLHIPLARFEAEFQTAKDSQMIKEYIAVPTLGQ